MNWLLVSLGGAAGAWLRFYVSGRLAQTSKRYPWATWIINVCGSLLLGLLAGMRYTMPASVYLLLGVGFCGAFTTFSTFTVETLQLLQARRFRAAALYMLSSAVVCLLCAAIGLQLSFILQ
ncbi:fluoride efflux transporter CrcB [Paenibacillus marinisediminis]